MLSELRKYVQRQRRPNVLILILLDHALRESWWKTNHHFKHLVLILILLDHALRDLVKAEEEYVNYVLILILLDHALRGHEIQRVPSGFMGLNPYSIGPCSPSYQ